MRDNHNNCYEHNENNKYCLNICCYMRNNHNNCLQYNENGQHCLYCFFLNFLLIGYIFTECKSGFESNFKICIIRKIDLHI